MTKSILNKTFRYVPAASTNIRLTFARIRREQKAKDEASVAAEAEAKAKLVPIKRAK